MNLKKTKLSIIGLGYVGLPLAIEFGKNLNEVVGFDINKKRISELKLFKDSTGEILYKPFRPGDIRHSLANISKIKKELEFETNTNFKDSLKSTIKWFINQQ